MTTAGEEDGRAAYRRDGGLVSRRAFYAAACDPRLSCVVEACAGAGKTWMLVSRILRALLDGAEPQDILAITFTRKAAGEMRERLDEWLAGYAMPGVPAEVLAQALVDRGMGEAAARQAVPALRGLHERVLAAGRPVEIRTFHAWFSQLLGAAPLELLDALGLRRDLVLIEDEEEYETDVFRRFHAAVARDEALAEDFRALVERRGRSDARRWLKAAWHKRTEISLADEAGVLEAGVEPATPPGPDGRRPHPAETLRTPAWRLLLGELAAELGRGKGKTMRDAAAGLASALATGDDPADAPALFDAVRGVLLTKEGTPRRNLGDGELLVAVLGRLDGLGKDIAQHEAWLEHGRMVRLSRTLLAEYAAFKRQRGLADMADLERCALALLGDPLLAGWVQERLDLRVRHLLIDEFQDTSPLQWQALHGWLAGYAGAGGGASGQRPPGVFIVGDPKQSIYRFRRAEPRVFAAAREFVVEGLGGAGLACDHTRRNSPAVLDVLNAVFGEAEAQGEFDGFRAHTTEVGDGPRPALAALPGVPRPPAATRAAAGAAPPPVWRDTLTTPRHEPEAVLREQEAARVAGAVAATIAAGRVAPGEVFVLCRRREPLRLAAAALQARRIACAQVEPATLMDVPEVRDLVAVIDALVSPRHRLSLAQALKSPLLGVDDADLLHLAQRAAEDDIEWWAALMREAGTGAAEQEAAAAGGVAQGDAVPAGAGGAAAQAEGQAGDAAAPPRPALARAARLLASWHEAASRLPPHDLLDRIVAEGDALRRYAAAVPPARRAGALAAIEALLAQALLLEGGRYATPYGFVRALKRRAVKAVLPAAADTVQLLTIHGAKGLEARAVFLMDTAPGAPQGERLTLLVDWPVGHDHPLRCAFVGSEARCPPSLQALLERENAARAREDLNLLYVALTRARERLVVSHTEPHRPARGTCWRDRLAPRAVPWPGDASGDGAAAHAGGEADAAPFVLRELPFWPGGQAGLPAGRAGPGGGAAAGPGVPGYASANAAWAGTRAAVAADADAGNRPGAGAVAPAAPGVPDAARGPGVACAPGGAGDVGAAARHGGAGLGDAVSRGGKGPRVTSAGDDDTDCESLPVTRRGVPGTARSPATHASADPAARLGCAVHRVLEWATQLGAAPPDEGGLAVLADAAAAEFGVDSAETRRRAGAVLRSASCARFFGGPALQWAGNEVAVADAGEALRIDRLACLDAPGEPGGRVWWVLDYKLHHAPQSLAAYREQLLRYRAAVARLQPGEAVRCAFVAGGGELVEVDAVPVETAG